MKGLVMRVGQELEGQMMESSKDKYDTKHLKVDRYGYKSKSYDRNTN